MNKGPFVQGSSVDVYPIDSSGNPTGADFPTVTSDALGTFSVTLKSGGPVLLKGSGYYYNEASGALSASALTLSALASIVGSGSQNAYINLVTHLAEAREVSLLSGGTSLSDAVTQAEGELRTALAIGGPNFNPNAQANQLNLLGGDDDKSAYLFAVSSVFAFAASTASSTAAQPSTGSSDAQLQALINTSQASFAADGKLPSATTAQLTTAQRCVEPNAVMQAVATYLGTLDLSPSPVVPNINRALDTDGDGVPNLSDTCPLIANAPATTGGTQPVVSGVCDYGVSVIPVSYDPENTKILVGDVDGKNGPDFVLISGDAVDVRMNDGAGAFGAAVTSSPSVVEGDLLADIDGDGHLDLVGVPQAGDDAGADNLGERIAFYFPGDGKGRFGDQVEIALIDGSIDAIADLNGDGRNDIVVVRNADEDNVLEILLAPSWTTTALPLPTSGNLGNIVRAVDWNGDGHVDLLASSSAGTMFYAGNGTGAFGAGSLLGNVNGFAAVGDVDGDGKLDLVGSDGSSIVVSFGDGVGGVTSTTTLDMMAAATFPCGSFLPDSSGSSASTISVGPLAGTTQHGLYVGLTGQGYIFQGHAATALPPFAFLNQSLQTTVNLPATPESLNIWNPTPIYLAGC